MALCRTCTPNTTVHCPNVYKTMEVKSCVGMSGEQLCMRVLCVAGTTHLKNCTKQMFD